MREERKQTKTGELGRLTKSRGNEEQVKEKKWKRQNMKIK